MQVDEALCRGDACGCNRLCTRIFRCPGLLWDREKKKAQIDEVICAGCGVCAGDLSGRGHSLRGGGTIMKHRQLRKDPFNIVITGVGGQGNVMASRVLSKMLVRRGFRVTIGETFGMSQRGGSVMSHIRVSSSSVWSPQIPKGRADLIVAIEPVEALRVLADYGNPAVKVLVNMRPIYPVGVITGEADYPAPETIREDGRGPLGDGTAFSMRRRKRSNWAIPFWGTSS